MGRVLLSVLLFSLAHAQQYLFNPCRVVDNASLCYYDDFSTGNGFLDSTKFTQIAQQGADQAPGLTSPRWTHEVNGGFSNMSGEIRGDQNRVMGSSQACDQARGSIFLLRQATLPAANPKARYLRAKFRFNNAGDRCAGIVLNYNTPNDFFVASVCRNLPNVEGPCLRFRQYLLGQWVQIATLTLASNFTQRIDTGVWLEFDLQLSPSGNTFGVTFANAPVSGVMSFVVPSGIAEWHNRADQQIGFWSSFADVSWDDVSIADNVVFSQLEYVHRVCRSTSCPASGPGSLPWCRCCFFDCFAPALGRGERQKCVADGLCSTRCLTTTFCPAVPTPAPTPVRTPAPTPAPTPEPPAAPRNPPFANSCVDASRFLNPDSTAGVLCSSCNKYALSTNVSENCNWCDGGPGGFSFCITAAQLAAVPSTCSAPSRVIRSEADCPTPCIPAPPASQCLTTPGTTVATSGLCSLFNNASYSDQCYRAATQDGPACLRAVRRFDCSRECQACRPELASPTRAFLLSPCKSVCDSIISACPLAQQTCLSARKCAAANALCASTVSVAGDSTSPTPMPTVDANSPCGRDQDRDGVSDCDDNDLNIANITAGAFVPVWDGSLAALVAFDAPTGLASRGVQRLRVLASSTSTPFSASLDIDALSAAGQKVAVMGLGAGETLTVCIRPVVSVAAALVGTCLAVFDPATSAFACQPGALSAGTGPRAGTVCGATAHLSRFVIAAIPTTTTTTSTTAATTSTVATESTTSAPITTSASNLDTTTLPVVETTSGPQPTTVVTTVDPTTTASVPDTTPSMTTVSTTGGTGVVTPEPTGISQGGVIAIAVVFGLLGLFLIGLVVFCIVRNRRSGKKGDDLGSRELTDKVVPKDTGTDKVYENEDEESDSNDKKKKAASKPAAADAKKADNNKGKAAAATSTPTVAPTPTTAAEAKKPAGAAAAAPAETKKPETKKVAVKEESESSSGSEYSYEEDAEEDVKPPPSRKPPAPDPATETKKEAAPALPSSPSPAAAGADTSSESDLFGDDDDDDEESGDVESGSYSESSESK